MKPSKNEKGHTNIDTDGPFLHFWNSGEKIVKKLHFVKTE